VGADFFAFCDFLVIPWNRARMVGGGLQIAWVWGRFSLVFLFFLNAQYHSIYAELCGELRLLSDQGPSLRAIMTNLPRLSCQLPGTPSALSTHI
jgi:hypothetical protein